MIWTRCWIGTRGLDSLKFTAKKLIVFVQLVGGDETRLLRPD